MRCGFGSSAHFANKWGGSAKSQGNGSQIRVTGVLEQVQDEVLREGILNHPSRKFLQAWKANGIDSQLQILRLKKGASVEWTMETNFDEKLTVQL